MGTERDERQQRIYPQQQQHKHTKYNTGEMPAAMKMRTARPARSAKKAATRGRTARAVSTNACMLVWKPRIQFETFSYLPPLSDDDIKKQPAYGPGFYYNRYWMMWKLPMFGCTDGDQVLQEVANCKKEYPDHYIRVVGFNAEKQVQMAS